MIKIWEENAEFNNGPQSQEKKSEASGDPLKNRNHTDHYSVKISKNIPKNPETRADLLKH